MFENNKYAMGTAVERHSCNKEKLYKRGEPMRIKGEEVDGMDFFAVYDMGFICNNACSRRGRGL